MITATIAAESSLVNSAASPYTHYSFALTATSATTDLRFTFTNPPSLWEFDSVSVNEAAAIPEPATLALLSLGLAGLGFSRGRTRN